jgi:membrane protein implicated in regulation of membrane protease activity
MDTYLLVRHTIFTVPSTFQAHHMSNIVNDMLGCTVPGVVGATATILLTTLDDCVWLVPFVVQADTRSIAWQHAGIFAATLISLTTTVSIVTVILQQGFHRVVGVAPGTTSSSMDFDLIWSCVGAVLCWSLAAYFFYRSWQKKKRRQREAEERHKREEAASESLITSQNIYTSYGMADDVRADEEGSPMAVSSAQPWTVISLTLLGALDEVSYFPALVVGKVFTVAELVLGTVLTVAIMLFIVVQCLSQCRPLLDLLDRIPLYAVVTAFAILLTAEVVWDVVTPNDD